MKMPRGDDLLRLRVESDDGDEMSAAPSPGPSSSSGRSAPTSSVAALQRHPPHRGRRPPRRHRPGLTTGDGGFERVAAEGAAVRHQPIDEQRPPRRIHARDAEVRDGEEDLGRREAVGRGMRASVIRRTPLEGSIGGRSGTRDMLLCRRRKGARPDQCVDCSDPHVSLVHRPVVRAILPIELRAPERVPDRRVMRAIPWRGKRRAAPASSGVEPPWPVVSPAGS